MRCCRRCGAEFDETLRYDGAPRCNGGVKRSFCSSKCAKAYGNSRVDQWKHQLKSKYGLTRTDWDRMFSVQGGRCASCDKPFQAGHPKWRAVVDHCHETGMVRALLCNRCNRAVGLMEDKVSLLRRGAAYLREYPQ